ncbi:MAG: ArsR/SmtB family transcription factor [Candidatus Promineifilaceae bacterium]|jgi:ArsR family transcriptional regulator, virulence genes transcriptional regulator
MYSGNGKPNGSEVRTVDEAEDQAALCRIFANPKRIMILWSVAEQERAVTAIAETIDASLQSTSQHLSVMKAAGILAARRDGQTIYYRIAENDLASKCHLILEARGRCLPGDKH